MKRGRLSGYHYTDVSILVVVDVGCDVHTLFLLELVSSSFNPCCGGCRM